MASAAIGHSLLRRSPELGDVAAKSTSPKLRPQFTMSRRDYESRTAAEGSTEIRDYSEASLTTVSRSGVAPGLGTTRNHTSSNLRNRTSSAARSTRTRPWTAR